MAGPEKPKGVEVKVLETSSMSVKLGSGILEIGEALGIRKSALEPPTNLGSLQIGDIFQLDRKSDGTGTLRKIRAGKTLATYDLSKEAIYQNIEKGPDAFPYISFVRQPESNQYKITGKNGEILKGDTINISAANLDAFRKELTTVSGAFIAECGSRKSQNDMRCEVEKIPNSSDSVDINSKRFFDFIPTSVSLQSLIRLTKTKNIDPINLAEILAFSLPFHQGEQRESNIPGIQLAKESLLK